MNRLQKSKKSAKIADAIITQVIAEFREGDDPRDVSAKIKRLAKQLGAQKCSFRPLVLCGKRSAKPHGPTSKKKLVRLRRRKLIIVDLGVVYKEACSDITRTVVLGKPTSKQKYIYNIVRKAQGKALRKVKAGIAACKVDKAARDYISKAGFGKYFVHSTGHGVGKKIHQPPKISRHNRNTLKAGQVITIEPGIYIKGWGGVRIEDMVLVTKNGYNRLTKAIRKIEIRKYTRNARTDTDRTRTQIEV